MAVTDLFLEFPPTMQHFYLGKRPIEESAGRTKGRLRVKQGKLTSLPNVDHWLYLSVEFFSVYLC